MYLLGLIFGTVLATTLAITATQRETIQNVGTECRREVGLTNDEFEDNANNNKFDSPPMKKHLLCAFKKFGLASENGDVDKQILKHRVSTVVGEDKANGAVNKCAVKKDTPEDTVYELMGCLTREVPIFSPVD